MKLIVIGVVLWCGMCMGQAHRAGATASGCSSASKSVAWMNEWVDDGKEFDSDKGMRRRVLAKDGQLNFQEDLPSDSGGQEFEQRNVFVAMNDLGDADPPSESFGGHWNMTVRARQGAAEGPFRITLQRIRGTATVSGPEEVARSAYYVIHFRNGESAHAAYKYLRCKTR